MKRKNILLISCLTASLALVPANAYAYQKSETVYTNLNYDGTVEKTSVTNHLSFTGNYKLEDDSELLEILNISGDEKYTKEDNSLTWSPLDKDIFYRGSTSKTLPITTEVKYYLDGEEKDISTMIGKSGHVKIEYRFKNESKNYVSINGRMETIYTPFMTSIATVVDGNVKNISVTNGRVTSTGARSTVVAIASPGLYESTKLKEFKTFDKVVIEYDTESFALKTTYIVSTPKLLEEQDLSIFSKVNSLSKNIDALKTNIAKIEEGAKALEKGTKELESGSVTLSDSLEDASLSLKKLQSGAISLDKGIDKVIDALASAKGILASSHSSELAILKSKNDTAIGTLASKITAAGIPLDSLNLACQDVTNSDPLLADETVQIYCLLNANNKAVSTVAKESSTLGKELDTLIEGLKTLKTGSATLSTGLEAMTQGLDKLYAGSKALQTGSQKLVLGATTLSQGTSAYKKEGIDQLVNYANTFQTYSNRAEALVKTSKNYKGFSSTKSDDVLFVSMISSYKD